MSIGRRLWLAMGLTKQYLRYAATAVFGVIGSQKTNIIFVNLRGGERGRYVAVGACEHVFIWDVRKAEKVKFESLRYHYPQLSPSSDSHAVSVPSTHL